jgi:FG-GAP-like repeat
MRTLLLAGLATLSLSVLLGFALSADAPKLIVPPEDKGLTFEMREIDKSLTVGYAVLPVDINGDGKTDFVVVDSHRVLWYENPTWKPHVIIGGITAKDNVCVAAYDIDGDGKVDLAIGAGWAPFNTKAGGTLQWLKRGKTLDEPWQMIPIGEEPTVHRMGFVDLDGSGKAALVVVPLMGRNSSAAANWMDGSPTRILAYRIPKDPTRDRWIPEVIDESLHVVHNFYPVNPLKAGRKGHDLLTASYEGVTRLSHDGDHWERSKVGAGNQVNLKSNRGASEVKLGKLKGDKPFVATIEPWHGNEVVVYTPGSDPKAEWERHVIDNQLKWGHAVWCADLDGDGSDELIIGVRDNLGAGPGQRSGVRIYRTLDGEGVRWSRQLVDEGGGRSRWRR